MSFRLSIAFPSLLFLAALAAAFVFLLRPADAATFVVTKTADTNDGVCDTDCSLREAIKSANASVGVADVISLPAGTYTLIIPSSGEDLDATGDLDITDDLTIDGGGAATTIIQACDSSAAPCAGIDRVLHILSGTVSITAVTVQNGSAPGNAQVAFGGGIYNVSGSTLTLTDSIVDSNTAASAGGGVRNSGTMTLTNSTVSGNIATAGAAGGGIGNSGTLTLINSTVSGNTAPTTGGITNVNFGTLTLTNSTVSGNTATNFGSAGIYNGGTATITNSTVSANTAVGSGGGGITNVGSLTLSNSTISGNTSNSDGGGIYNFDVGITTINNSTITNNTADLDASNQGDGGGVFRAAGTVNLKNTILAGNVDGSSAPVEPDCFGTLTSQGYNLIQTVSAGCSITGDTATNVTGQSANLGPLAVNAPGTTETHAILNGSPAIDFASADCPPPATDQRGVTRPQGNRCDIGAYESSFSGPTPVPTPSPVPTPTPSATPSPTLSPTPTPPATASPTTTGSVSPTGTSPATPTGSPVSTRSQGDVNCDGSVGQPDFDFLLRFAAGLNDGTTPGDCPDLGEINTALAVAFAWGDVNCDSVVDAIDALYLLAHTVDVDLPQIGVDCIPIGDNIP